MDRSDSIYRIRVFPDGFFTECLRNRGTPYKWNKHSLFAATKKIVDEDYQQYEDLLFDLSVVVLSLSTNRAIEFYDLVGETRSINAEYNPDTMLNMFLHYSGRLAVSIPPEGKERRALDPHKLTSLLSESLEPLRTKLGWEVAPVQYTYSITDDVYTAATTDASHEYVERLDVMHKHIFPDMMDKIASTLENFDDVGKNILDALNATRVRTHFSSLSITDIGGELMVCLANRNKQRLRVEAWKFLALLDDPNQPKMLSRIERLDYREKTRPFLFNDLTTGDVHAIFKPKRSTIHVVCQREEDKLPADRAEFIVDPDMALCMYVLLHRLREDKEEFARLWEEATVESSNNPFESLYMAEEEY